jgi:endonuclease/exonuclease/phosphatase (EEP) superfamily protein YafD
VVEERRAGFLDRLLVWVAVVYPIALLVIAICLRFVGERWWVTAVGLYLPRLGFALPLPVLTVLLLWRGRRRLLITQAVALVLLVFPLMGLRIAWHGTPSPDAFHLRVLTFNVATGPHGNEPLLAVVRSANPDVIVFQETHESQYDGLKAGLADYHVRISGQFLMASRFPIDDLLEPPKIPHNGVLRSPRWVRFRVSTPAGLLQIYDIHPISPRDALDELRGEGLRHEIKSGRLGRATASAMVKDNTSLRLAQLQQIADDARQSPYPVLLAGDTNLPTLSWVLPNILGAYRDGFSEAGNGFGLTFPAPRHPWMRIDRILADSRFRFLDFTVLKSGASDHYAVTADLELLRP